MSAQYASEETRAQEEEDAGLADSKRAAIEPS